MVEEAIGKIQVCVSGATLSVVQGVQMKNEPPDMKIKILYIKKYFFYYLTLL